MPLSLKIDDRKFRAAFREYAAYSKKAAADVLKAQARLFVRDVLKVTPPNSGHTGKKAGDLAVRADILGLMVASRKPTAEDAAVIHARYRTRRGRVDKRSLRRKQKIPARNLRSLLRQKLAHVGFLGGGWNAGALKLGARPPAWMRRHGTTAGTVRLKLTGAHLSIAVTNKVRYAGQVAGLQRRVQWALDNRAVQMRKQLDDYAVRRAAKKAGLGVR